MVHLQLLTFRVIQELFEDFDALTQEIGIETATHLIKGLLCFPLMLIDEDLVRFTVKSEELFLVLVGQLAYISMCMLPMCSEQEFISCYSNEISVCWKLNTILLQWIVLSWLLIVIHLDARVMLFD